MAGRIPSFLSSSKLVIKMGQSTLAYATSLTFSDDMANVPVGGIGSMNFHTNEPVGYLGRGSIVITQYSDKVYNLLKQINNPQAGVTAANKAALPDNLRSDKQNSEVRDGNSLLIKEYFSPLDILSQRTFDIEVYERSADGSLSDLNGNGPINEATGAAQDNGIGALYILKDCRMTSYNLSFTPGQLLSEAVSFLCLSVIDSQSESGTKLISYKEQA